MSRLYLIGSFAFAIGIISSASVARADDAAPSDAKLYQQTVQRGVDFLVNKGQEADGSYGKQVGPGVAAICTLALLKHGRSPDDPAVAKGLKFIETFIHEDGGIYTPKQPVQNYETSLALMCLTAANADGRFTDKIKNAEKFLKSVQWGGDASSVNFGGAGYGSKNRPDLSNTQFFLDALQAAGTGKDDEAVKRALTFVSKCQNLESEHNTTAAAKKASDADKGGFYYTPAGGGVSEAGPSETGGVRSYGSMTYAGLKSMIYAGVTADDPRVKAALDWIKRNYTVTANPGMLKGEEGLYYYYHTFAKALDAAKLDEIEDAQGVKHNWRHDLLVELAKRQKEDGSWVNANSRFLEGNTNLVTAYALLTLSYAKPKELAAESK